MDQQEKNNKKLPVWVWILIGVVFAALIALVVVLIVMSTPKEMEAPSGETASLSEEAATGTAPADTGSSEIVTAENTQVENSSAGTPSESGEAPSGTEAAPAEPQEPGYGNNTAAALPSYGVETAVPGSEEMMAVVAVNQKDEDCLTNGELQIYYWLEFYSFMNTYGQYAPYMMDLSKPLGEQPSLMEGRTWEQSFLEAAAEHYSQNYAMWQKAEAEGITLSEDQEKEIADLADPQGAFAEEAKKNNFDSNEAYVQANFGDGVSVADYQHYLRTFYLASEYFSGQQKEIADSIDDAAIDAYFEGHADAYAEKNLRNVNDVAVRHILVTPEAEENAEPTEEAWKAAGEKADELYAQWQKDPTEDNFSAMATENTADPGSKNSGGLYDTVAPGQMVPEFDAWCFDPARKAGDSGIVKTTYGYHIMYFVGQKDTAHWRDVVRNDILKEKMSDLMSKLIEEYPVKFDFTKVRIFDLVAKNAPETEPEG